MIRAICCYMALIFAIYIYIDIDIYKVVYRIQKTLLCGETNLSIGRRGETIVTSHQ